MTPGPGRAVAWVDGALLPRAEARLSIDDFGLRYGAACFETMLARSGRLFRLDAHLDRLEAGLRALRVQPPERATLTEGIDALLVAGGLSEGAASVRLSVSAGRGNTPDLGAALAPSVVIVAEAAPPPAPPSRLRVVSVRLDEHRPMRGAKTANFLPYLLARAEAREAGADDALLLNHAGHVAEAATANLFAWLDGALVTPRLDDGPLPGVTRAALIEVADESGLRVDERTMTLGDLERSEAVLLTASVQGIRMVAGIEGEPPAAPSTVTWTAAQREPEEVTRLREAYEALVGRECGEA